MLFDVNKLWRERKHAYMKEIIPYTRYVGQSGLLLVIAFLGIVFFDQYFSFIRNIPKAFPVAEAGALIWATMLYYSPLRTWLREPDLIYLMPQDKAMRQYIWLSVQRSFILSSLPAIIVVALYWPIYASQEHTSYILMLLAIIVCKLANFTIAMEGRKLAQPSLRFFLSFARYTLSLLAIYAMIKNANLVVLAVIVLMSISIIVLLRKMNGSFFPWQYYIAEEQRTMHRTYRFLSWFVDIPSKQSYIKKRNFLSVWSRLIRYHPSSAFTYLHYLTFARTEVGGIYIRLIAVGSFITYIFSDMQLWNSYGALMSLLFFCFIVSMQLTTLRQAHRNSVWRFIFPVSLSMQHAQMMRIESLLSTIAFSIIFTIGYIPYWSNRLFDYMLYPLLGIVVIFVWRTVAMKRNLRKKLEDD